jgi:hypothetical protein
MISCSIAELAPAFESFWKEKIRDFLLLEDSHITEGQIFRWIPELRKAGSRPDRQRGRA